jgi:hypothetical protein
MEWIFQISNNKGKMMHIRQATGKYQRQRPGM